MKIFIWPRNLHGLYTVWYLIFLSRSCLLTKGQRIHKCSLNIHYLSILILFGTTLKPLLWLFSSLALLRLFVVLISSHISKTDLLAQILILSPILNLPILMSSLIYWGQFCLILIATFRSALWVYICQMWDHEFIQLCFLREGFSFPTEASSNYL